MCDAPGRADGRVQRRIAKLGGIRGDVARSKRLLPACLDGDGGGAAGGDDAGGDGLL